MKKLCISNINLSISSPKILGVVLAASRKQFFAFFLTQVFLAVESRTFLQFHFISALVSPVFSKRTSTKHLLFVLFFFFTNSADKDEEKKIQTFLSYSQGHARGPIILFYFNFFLETLTRLSNLFNSHMVHTRAVQLSPPRARL